MKEIAGFVLSSGFQIIGEINSEDEQHFIIHNPRSVQLSASSQGQIQMSFIPLTVLAEKDLEVLLLCKSMILAPFTPKKEISDNYIQHVTGISIASPEKVSGLNR